MEQGAQFAVSPRGVHMGIVSHSGSRWTVVYDGVPGPKFDQIFPAKHVFDRRHLQPADSMPTVASS